MEAKFLHGFFTPAYPLDVPRSLNKNLFGQKVFFTEKLSNLVKLT